MSADPIKSGEYKRIIPCLDLKDGRVVKGVNFVGLRDAGDPVEVAKRYNDQGADELTFLDITATTEGREAMYGVLQAAAQQVTIPLTVGGGVRHVDDVKRLLDLGATKVSVGSAAVANPGFIREIATRYGSEHVVVAIDARQILADGQGGQGAQGGADAQSITNAQAGSGARWEVVTHGGQRGTGLDAVAWAQRMVDEGAGELLVTSLDRDGTKDGFDLGLTRAIADAVSVPVIASGGVGNLEHLYQGIVQGGASAVLAASIFHYGEYTIAECKAYLRERGIAVRMD